MCCCNYVLTKNSRHKSQSQSAARAGLLITLICVTLKRFLCLCKGLCSEKRVNGKTVPGGELQGGSLSG